MYVIFQDSNISPDTKYCMLWPYNAFCFPLYSHGRWTTVMMTSNGTWLPDGIGSTTTLSSQWLRTGNEIEPPPIVCRHLGQCSFTSSRIILWHGIILQCSFNFPVRPVLLINVHWASKETSLLQSVTHWNPKHQHESFMYLDTDWVNLSLISTSKKKSFLQSNNK